MRLTIILSVFFIGMSASLGGDMKNIEKDKLDLPDIQGMIVEKTDNSLTIVWNKDDEILQKKVKNSGIISSNVMTVSYSDTKEFAIGNEVAVWTTGKYNDKSPVNGTATSVKLISEKVKTPFIQGIVLEKTENAITVGWGLSKTDLTSKEKEDVLKIIKPNAMTVSYSNTENFNYGDKVVAWTTGKYNESYPSRGTAVNIVKYSSLNCSVN